MYLKNNVQSQALKRTEISTQAKVVNNLGLIFSIFSMSSGFTGLI